MNPSPPARRSRPWLALFLFCAGCLVVGALAGLATVDGVRTWYRTIAKPSWTPPDWIFGPVWTGLYLAMGVAAWRVWRHPSSVERRRALRLFGVQLALNAAWSPVFFALERPAIALGVIVTLDLALAATIVSFRRVEAFAAGILGPYLAWCIFATALNFAIVRLLR